PASVDLLIHLLALSEEVPILMIFAFRPERQSPAWQLKLKAETDFPHRYLELTLNPLSTGDCDALVSDLLMIRDLPYDVRQLIIRKADGNPYFAEVIVRTLVEQGAVYDRDGERHWKECMQLTDVAIPDSIQPLLMARIDRLDAEAKATLQMASVIGRSF